MCSRQMLSGSRSLGVAVGDLDGDGDLDAFVANAAGSGEGDQVWLNNGSGVFTDNGQSLGNAVSSEAELGDLTMMAIWTHLW